MALCLTLPIAALAFPPDRPSPPDPAEKAAHMTERLDLSAEQASAMEAIFRKTVDAAEPLRLRIEASRRALQEAVDAGDEDAMASAIDDLEADRLQMRSLHEQSRDEVTDLLTVRQSAKMMLEPPPHDRMRGQERPPRSGARPDRSRGL
jgi:Spy/CpxP family protein refolding chaperone